MILRLLMLILIFPFMLSACSQAALTGAGSMRVEIEVYEGPVGQSAAVNVGQISALLDDTLHAVVNKQKLANMLKEEHCSSPPKQSDSRVNKKERDCLVLNEAINAVRLVAARICDIDTDHNALGVDDTGKVINLCQELKPDTNISNAQNYSWRDPVRITQISEQMRLAAIRLTEAYVGYVPKEKEVRHIVQDINYLLDGRSGDLANRSYILEKQIAECLKQRRSAAGNTNGTIEVFRKNRKSNVNECTDISELALTSSESSRKYPTGDYLRGSQPSRFIEAFDWFNANLNAPFSGAYLRRNRVRAIRALTEERHWESVNEVYHSGQGDVAAAFIKDELGNWSLKSYSNRPGDLLDAYRSATDAAIVGITGLVRGAAGDPTVLAGASNALDLADRLATGRKPAAASIGALSLDAFRERTLARLKSAKDRYIAEAAKLERLVKDENGNDTDESEGQIKDLQIISDEAEEKWKGAVQRTSAAEQKKIQSEAESNACKSTNANDLSKCEQLVAQADLDKRSFELEKAALGSTQTEYWQARDKLAAAKATLANIGDRAAAEADRILKDYQDDLDTMREAVVAENEAEPAPEEQTD